VWQIGKALETNLLPGGSDRLAQRTRTMTVMLNSMLRAAITFTAILAALAVSGVEIGPLLASAGVVGIALGLGAQNLIKDLIAGFLILYEDQFGVGDAIEVDGKTGIVERLNFRITRLRTLSGDLVTIPNGQIKVVVNQSNAWSRAILEVTVPHETDHELALDLMNRVARELRADWSEKVLAEPETIGIQAFGETGMTLRVLLKTGPQDRGAVAAEWRRRIKHAFDDAGITFPGPLRKLDAGGISG
jgi:small conductance mechanosensitive channel